MSSSCNTKCTSSTCYCYTGLNLPCINVLTNESLTDIVQKIEYELCLLLGQITTTTTSSSSSTTTTTTTTLVNEPLCAAIQAEIDTIYRDITSIGIANGKFAYSIEGFEIFWNNLFSRWESWDDGELSSYLENSENYPIGTWTPVVPVPYISVITLGGCPASPA